jgi:Icc-related predicted phosphoesterase
MYTLFFTADIQGSDICWNKLLNAADLFHVDALIVSGNLIGSALQPMVREEGGTWRSVLGQTPVRVKTREEISALEEKIRSLGRYPYRVSPEEALELEHSPTLRQKRLEQEARRALRHWLELAEGKLKKAGRRLIMMAGEQDPSFVDAIIGESSAVERAHGKIITLNPNHKLISAGSFRNGGQEDDSHRFKEQEMFRHLQDRVSELGEVYRNIFNIQIPPLDATLCNAVCLNCAREKDNRSDYYPPGSAAVRRLIETYQPLLSLHGNTHGRDNKFTHIGRTLCCVPGNGRLEGLLSGFLITLKKSEILDFQPIQG